MTDAVSEAVNILWDYMQLHTKPVAADCLLVLGSRDDRVASYAAELVKQFQYKTVTISGGTAHHNDLLATNWAEPTEAEHFLAVMRETGCEKEVLLEKKATNTGENARFSYEILAEQGNAPSTMQILTKPYMERRVRATFAMQWPDVSTTISITSPPSSFADYVNDEQPADSVINIMVGDFQRIMEYPKFGLQAPEHIPAEVSAAYERLIVAGYEDHLIKTV